MADRWFYVHGAPENSTTRNGPFSSREFAGLAASGQILPTDTVWKEGIETGVLARRVKNLFRVLPGFSSSSTETSAEASLPPALKPELAPFAPAANKHQEVTPAATSSLPPPEPIPDDVGLLPETAVPPVAEQPGPPPKHVRKGRAVAGKGAVILGQDGACVKFKSKCTVCGHEDATRNTLKITSGTMRVGFYCPKCRKRREVELHGYLS